LNLFKTEFKKIILAIMLIFKKIILKQYAVLKAVLE